MTTVITKTKACLVDCLKQDLAMVTSSTSQVENRKYYLQASKMLWIGEAKPVPSFIVNLSDLTTELIDDLYDLDKEDRNFVLKQAVGRIFEDVNYALYHDSISRVLKVKLER